MWHEAICPPGQAGKRNTVEQEANGEWKRLAAGDAGQESGFPGAAPSVFYFQCLDQGCRAPGPFPETNLLRLARLIAGVPLP